MLTCCCLNEASTFHRSAARRPEQRISLMLRPQHSIDPSTRPQHSIDLRERDNKGEPVNAVDLGAVEVGGQRQVDCKLGWYSQHC
jgi:hypothetical protein